MVEYCPAPSSDGSLQLLTISTTRPRFSFVPHGAWQHPGAGVSMSHFRITVSTDDAAPRMLWDSGMVQATSAAAVQCGVELPRQGYTWTAQWWAGSSGSSTADPAESPAASPVATAAFEIGPNNTTDWAATPWVGGSGQTEFRLQFAAGAAVAKLFVAAPGGAVVRER